MADGTILTDRLPYLDIAKGIGIILVVIGHCIPDAASPAGIPVPAMKVLHDVIYSFHMPLFFFISGFLISRKVGSIQSKKTLITKKIKRLLIPYFFVGLCYAPLKLLLSQFANKPYDFNNLWKIFLGVNPDGELWFLYALFMISLIAIVLNKQVSKIGLGIAGILTLTSPVLPIVTSYIFYFFLGIYMRENAPQYFERMKISTAILYAGIFSGINLAVLVLGE